MLFFPSPTKIIDQSPADRSRYSLSWEVRLFLPHIPPPQLPRLISHQIWFVWRWSWCFIYFCPARQPAGALWVSWFIRAEQKQKERQPLSLHLLAYTLMKFSEMKFSATSIGLGRIVLKCFITAMVVACGISSFGIWHASFITMR